MSTFTSIQPSEHTSDYVHNFLEPTRNWVGYHPMGGNNFAGMTKIPHVNIIRDNGKLDSGQVLYFNPNTLTLDYSRGKEGSDVPDRSVIRHGGSQGGPPLHHHSEGMSIPKLFQLYTGRS
jgi:hypothetical protein